MEALRKARALSAPFAVLDVRCPSDVVRQRIERRLAEGTDASEADWTIHREQVATAEPFGEEGAHVVACESAEDPTLVLMRLLERFESQAAPS
jgi:predicted kinase